MLIADSGSTSTDWRIVDGQQVEQVRTQGMNPYFLSQEELQEILLQVPVQGPVHEVHFYGAGCGAEANRTKLHDAIMAVHPDAEIRIEGDMLAAARATCGHGPGLTAILGTGMNLCHYDGEKIADNRRGWGYVLGDEGSGADIGKHLVMAILNGELPDSVEATFRRRFQLDDDAILAAVYQQSNPNRFLAQFARFAFQNRNVPEVQSLVVGRFKAFFEKQVIRLEAHRQYPLHIVGSVGFFFGNELRKLAPDYGVSLGFVVQSPIAALTHFHADLDE